MRGSRTEELVFFWIMFVIVGYLAYSVMSPYLTSMIIAATLAVTFFPIKQKIFLLVGEKNTLASVLTVLLVLCIVLLPTIVLGILMLQEVATAYASLGSGTSGLVFVDQHMHLLEVRIQKFAPSFHINADTKIFVENFLSWVGGHLSAFFSGILSFVLQTFLLVIGMFFFFHDGPKIRQFIVKISPLPNDYDHFIIDKLEIAVSSVLKGALVSALVQGALVGIGFTLFGLSNPILWGAIAMIAALIPMIGTSIIIVPAAVLLFFSGSTIPAVGLLFWGVLVGVVDNILRPILMKRSLNIHPFLVLLSILGGLAYWGPIGFLTGPLSLAFFFTLLETLPFILGKIQNE